MTHEIQFLIDCLVQRLTMFLMRDEHLSLVEALSVVYNSQLYEKIVDLETGLYYQSPTYNYNYLRNELKMGKICAAQEF